VQRNPYELPWKLREMGAIPQLLLARLSTAGFRNGKLQQPGVRQDHRLPRGAGTAARFEILLLARAM